ncbi:MAG: HD domain-containing protein [Candidatus Omnitrophica bacterium]|nr:HD domain-containing protein [Candidatus Omnitrophota bacterium]
MIRKPLLLKLYDAAYMQRWNDRIRPVELTELDKQAHKMIIAYLLGKCEEDSGNRDVDWLEIIEGGLFEFLQRIILTDLKPPLFNKIKEDKEKYNRLNAWIYEKISPVIAPLGEKFCSRFKEYLNSSSNSINREIVGAAHFYATRWEFKIIERSDPYRYHMDEINKDFRDKQRRYGKLKGVQKFLSSSKLQEFSDICGQLRFQIRWSHLHRVPKTSVLGHMLIVAIISYLFSLEIKADKIRTTNNYFTGLFHDLPEVLTRDIINPVKRSVEGIREIIKEYEHEEMEKKIYRLIPKNWHPQMKMFTEDEFINILDRKGNIIRDGELIKSADDLSAFIEVYLAFRNGIKNEALETAKYALTDMYQAKVVEGINLGSIYADFES